MHLGDAGLVAAEANRGRRDRAAASAAQHVGAALVAGRDGIDALLHAEQAELGERRRFEFVVGEDLDVRRVIEREQADLIEVGDLAQFLGDADLVLAVRAASAPRRESETYSS